MSVLGHNVGEGFANVENMLTSLEDTVVSSTETLLEENQSNQMDLYSSVNFGVKTLKEIIDLDGEMTRTLLHSNFIENLVFFFYNFRHFFF